MELRFEPGDILAGKYRVDRVLAQGGMGVVVAATHVSLQQPVALKFMLPEVTNNADAVARFEREARTVARLKTEHVSRVFDVGELESGTPYIAMEFLDGEDLGTLIGHGARIPIEEAVEYVLHAGEALAEAHALGIVHRDVKPENLFVTRRIDQTPVVKVLDFGISKVAARSSRDRATTDTQEVMGSPAYMAPEQLMSTRDVDHRADIWGLGAILYEMVSGQPAFEAGAMVQLCARVLHESHVPLSARCPDVPPDFSAVIDRCLAKDKDERYPSVGELALALVPWAPERVRPVIDRILAVGEAAPVSDASADDSTSWDAVIHGERRRSSGVSPTGIAWGRRAPVDRGAAWIFGVAAVVAAASGIWWVASRESVADAGVAGARERSVAAAPSFEPPPAAAPPPEVVAPAAAPPEEAAPAASASASTTPTAIPASSRQASPPQTATAAHKPAPAARPSPPSSPYSDARPGTPANGSRSNPDVYSIRK